MLSYLKSNFPVIGNEYTPVAYTATALALSTHTHPIQALQYVFSNESYLELASDFDSSLQAAEAIIEEYQLPIYEEVGDLSGDPQLIGHMESLSTSTGEALRMSELSLEEMNSRFEDKQAWEALSCVGQACVANGIEWSSNMLLDNLDQRG